jgi:hypothetical protein
MAQAFPYTSSFGMTRDAGWMDRGASSAAAKTRKEARTSRLFRCVFKASPIRVGAEAALAAALTILGLVVPELGNPVSFSVGAVHCRAATATSASHPTLVGGV